MHGLLRGKQLRAFRRLVEHGCVSQGRLPPVQSLHLDLLVQRFCDRRELLAELLHLQGWLNQHQRSHWWQLQSFEDQPLHSVLLCLHRFAESLSGQKDQGDQLTLGGQNGRVLKVLHQEFRAGLLRQSQLQACLVKQSRPFR